MTARTEVSKPFILPEKDEHSAVQCFFNKPQIKIYSYVDDLILIWSNVHEKLSSRLIARMHFFMWTTKTDQSVQMCRPLRKHTYSNILKISPPKNENFQIKNSDIFHISARNINCGNWLELPHWGRSSEYPQSMLLSRNKKNNLYPCKPQFYYIKMGFNPSPAEPRYVQPLQTMQLASEEANWSGSVLFAI